MKPVSSLPLWPVLTQWLLGLALLGIVYVQNPDATFGVGFGMGLCYFLYNVVARLVGFEALNGAPISGPLPHLAVSVLMILMGVSYALTRSEFVLSLFPLAGAFISLSKRFYLAERDKRPGPLMMPSPGREDDPWVKRQDP